MAILSVLLSAVLVGCGGGEGGASTGCTPTMANPTPCPQVAANTLATGPSHNAAASIKFDSADTTNIALKGTGGFGRQEYSTLKFTVYDNAGKEVEGAQVDFVFSDSNTALTVGGLAILPPSTKSSSDGTVTTVVSAGTIPTSVRVVAKIGTGTSLITTLSNILVISTGVPDQKHFSLSTSTGNCEGMDIDQDCAYVTATLGDHFGNPAPDGTAVNFTTEGGVMGASCVTGSLPPGGATPIGQTTNSKVGPGSGACTVLLRASNPRPANGLVTILAYALGEEDLLDNTGASFTDKSPDIFRDDNEDGVWNPGEPCIGPNTNGACSTPGDGLYNGVLNAVLRTPQVDNPQTLYVWGQLVHTFSGSRALVSFNPQTLVCPAGNIVDVDVTVTDLNGNSMPAGTTIEFGTVFGGGAVGTVKPASVKVPNVVLAVGQPLTIPITTVTVGCPNPAASGQLIVTVTSPTTATTSRASLQIN
ncbi:MAG: hypothetical protein A3F78_15800 [Burkholderiales bacterium RIFCSPLOWO2_12_FULL_61_40]|nr:MAG: hypothetical protein A3F78_15800 [Burkholderiales bacterium RIFCSPLOWO2_12_FULL_61_40]